jgi:hypothetical protein
MRRRNEKAAPSGNWERGFWIENSERNRAMLGSQTPASTACFCGGVGGRPGVTPICLTCARLARVARVATERRLFWRWLQESSL